MRIRMSPRVYHPTKSWRWALIVTGLVFSLCGVAGCWFVARDPILAPLARAPLLIIVAAIGLLGPYSVMAAFRYTVTLFDDRIEVRGVWRTKFMLREEIRGLREPWPSRIVFYSKPPARNRLGVSLRFREDREWIGWTYSLPDLDREDRKKSCGEIRRNTKLGATAGQRMSSAARGRRLANTIHLIAWLLFARASFYPRPYTLVIGLLVALPVIALYIAHRSRGLFRLDVCRNDAHPSLAGAFIVPILALAVRAVVDYTIIDERLTAEFSLVLGLLFCVAVASADRPLRLRLALPLLFALLFGYGVVIEANALLGSAVAAGYNVPVQIKSVPRGKSARYEVTLPPWGDEGGSNALSIELEDDAFLPGDIVCLSVRRGALGIRWYHVMLWQRAASSVK
jgi:hypothetical protein